MAWWAVPVDEQLRRAADGRVGGEGDQAAEQPARAWGVVPDPDRQFELGGAPVGWEVLVS
jgi:hypothetical protein